MLEHSAYKDAVLRDMVVACSGPVDQGGSQFDCKIISWTYQLSTVEATMSRCSPAQRVCDPVAAPSNTDVLRHRSLWLGPRPVLV